MSTSLLVPTNDLLQLMVPGSKVEIFQPAATAKRDELIQRADAIERVVGEDSQQAAWGVLEDISGFLKSIDAERTTVVSPFLTAQRRVNDETKQKFVTALEERKSRMKKIMGDFQAELRKQADEEERKKNEELAKLQQEREAAVVAGNEEKVLAADLKAVEVVTAPVAVVPKAEGMKVVVTWVTTVVDIAALYKAFPEFVTLTPKMREINAAVTEMARNNSRLGLDDQSPGLPGCTVNKQTDVR
jgi:hypothetical protein